MPVIIYEGHILPDIVPLSLDYQPRLKRQETEGGSIADFELTVAEGRIRVVVETDEVSRERALELFMPAWDLARAFVDTAGFIRAIPYAVVLEHAELPDGQVMPLALGDRRLAATHSFTDADVEELADIFLCDLPASLALSDLLMMLGKAHYSPIACGRVAESIARLITPEGTKKRAWEQLSSSLRVDQNYVRLLTHTSTGPRHGDRQYVDAQTNREIAVRAWTLMDRYLRFRLNGELDPSEYPILTG